MSNKPFLLTTVLALATPAMAQGFLTTSTNALRHGDILCRVEIPYESEGERGEASVWALPAIPDDSSDHLQAIRCIASDEVAWDVVYRNYSLNTSNPITFPANFQRKMQKRVNN